MILVLPMLSHMLYDFFQKGMIFEFYGNWLFKEERQELDMPFYKKPLGGCLKCFHIWVCIFFTLSYSGFDVDIYKWILAVSISYYILIKNHYE